MQRIGIFGGTFDPPHMGHLIVAEHVCDALQLDQILFVPAGIPPHKQSANLSEPIHRLAMLKIALKGNGRFAISELELSREGASYTIDTLTVLRQRFPEAALTLIIGMDQLYSFSEWREPEAILAQVRVMAIARPGFSAEQVPSGISKKIEQLPVPLIQISSSDIRERLRTERSIRYLVPSGVEEYIRVNNLYQALAL